MRKCKKEPNDLLTGMKYHNSYDAKSKVWWWRNDKYSLKRFWMQQHETIGFKTHFRIFCSTHLHAIIAPKKLVERDKSKKKLLFWWLSSMPNEDQFKTQQSNMHGKIKRFLKFQNSDQWGMLRTWIFQLIGEDYVP